MKTRKWKPIFVLQRPQTIHLFTMALLCLFMIILVILRSVHLNPIDSTTNLDQNIHVTNLENSLPNLKSAIANIRQQKQNLVKRQLHTSSTSELNVIELHHQPKVKSIKSELIDDRIYWSDKAESLIPQGFTANDDLEFIRLVNQSIVVNMNRGCGRMQNRLLTLSNGEDVCARYRKNHDQIQGEFISFLLSRLLKIGNVPSTVLVQLASDDDRWSMVHNELERARWEVKPVVFTKYIPNLEPAYIPTQLRTKDRRLHPNESNLTKKTSDLIELVQWSDLIVLDYLTANLDRMLNNMINERWNPQMMESPAHNLLKINNNHNKKRSNLLVFLDNESGLFHGYRLLAKYESFHRSLLNSICIFRRSTIEQLQELSSLNDMELAGKIGQEYNRYTIGQQFNSISMGNIIPRKNLSILRRRMASVLSQVDHCRTRFDGSSQQST